MPSEPRAPGFFARLSRRKRRAAEPESPPPAAPEAAPAGPPGFEPIQRLAIVNRGEAAMRCIRAVKALRAQEGSALRALALFTEEERMAPFVRHADLAEPLSGSGVAAYLDHEGIAQALARAQADAVWPGWGFVAEDASFVEKIEAAGLRFLGPSPAAMRALGDKIGSKRLAERAGVPVSPWSGAALPDAEAAAEAARDIGYPLVVKASAGGGGRGIRIVERAEDLAAAFRSAAAEAEAAFGDGRLFVEQKVTGGRHIEVQIAADRHGTVHAVGCRDCSVQRRHQKVLEEAPPPGLSGELQQALCGAAVRIAAAAGYVGVGTVEFLVGGGEWFFLEMNPRLQVEHGITEETTGLDLVQLQIRIARGESLAGMEVQSRGCAIEARLCAEDPERGHLPSPGRIARFDPALGPRIRVDTGVAAGSLVPAAFDSLIAKVIAAGETREEARARLAAALADTELVIEGGASNKGYLAEILEHPEYRRGGVDTTWLDRFGAARGAQSEFAAPALLAAAILTYQRRRAEMRLNFYAEAGGIAQAPASEGQEVDLSHGGEQYRLHVFAVGAWGYRVHLKEGAEGGETSAVVRATLREQGACAARLDLGGRALRVLYDLGEAGLRVEVEGRAFAFSYQAAGQVRAATPAMVVSVNVAPGDAVSAGQLLGVLEAMKMEVGFEAPVSGTVSEVRARSGQQVAAGDVLLVIDASPDGAAPGAAARIRLAEEADPLQPLFAPRAGEKLGEPDLLAAERAPAAARRAALAAVREETRRVLLGYDATPARAERLAELHEAPLPDALPDSFCRELADLGEEICLLADLAVLFVRSRAASVSGESGPSNEARLRMYVRRFRAGGAGIAEDFLELVRRALSHYGLRGLEASDALERALLRLLASQQSGLRDRLARAMLRRIADAARRGVSPGATKRLGESLDSLARMRGLVTDRVADAAIEARYLLFEQPEIQRRAEHISSSVQAWLDAAAESPAHPPENVLRDFVDVHRGVFDRVGAWIDHGDALRRSIALAAHLRRAYSPIAPVEAAAAEPFVAPFVSRMALPDGRFVLGAACTLRGADQVLPAATRLIEASQQQGGAQARALEIFAPHPDADGADGGAAPGAAELGELLAPALSGGFAAERLTVTWLRPGGPDVHHTFVADAQSARGFRSEEALCGLHPEAARRIDLARLSGFELSRQPAPEPIYCFYARAREEPADERIFVLVDLRFRSPEREAQLHVPAFEFAFYEAARQLRAVLSLRDPKRRLQWNRIGVFLAQPVFLDPGIAQRLSRNLAPATRNLGIEKVVVRLELLDRAAPARAAETREFVISDVTGMNMTLQMREPRRAPLQPHSTYESRVVAARRRRLVYPYEIIRTLTGAGGAQAGSEDAAGIPPGEFEEFDLDPAAPAEAPRARSVSGRPYGQNRCGVVFGVIRTATDKVPEGMRRVLLLSDPTRGMGSLAAEECDRVEAALDLAEREKLPLEWIPVSSGARIAMDNGTENLDATARVVRRIVRFTQAGGAIHVIVTGVNVGAQSYWDALSTMLMHTRGALIMTQNASMVLTGSAALLASGSVSAESEQAIGGFERIMGPNGEAQYHARDLADAYRILYEHYRYTYVPPGERGPRRHATQDHAERSVGAEAAPAGSDFATVGEIFSDQTNPGRKRPFAMRAVMQAVMDRDGGCLERWAAWVGAETAIVWDAHLDGQPVCMIGIESRNIAREGYRPHDGPAAWNGGTLFPESSKKVARALNAASGNRPVVVLANLSGFDGSPESMRKLQLEHGAEIARAVVNFAGPILFLVVSRYHGGAYVVFSRALNPRLRAAALTGSYASVIGGAPAAKVVFAREVRARAARDPRVRALADRRGAAGERGDEKNYERTLDEVTLEKQAELAREFDAVHTVERARDVGSLEEIVPPRQMRAWLVRKLREELARAGEGAW